MTMKNSEKEYNLPYSTIDLFRLQADLIDSKVEVAVSKSINQVVEQLVNLRHEMHESINSLRYDVQRDLGVLRQETSAIQVQVTEVSTRLTGVEHALEKRHKLRSSVRDRFIDYAFKASWLGLASILTYVLLHVHMSVQL
jgi:hypothetical protein